MKFPHIKKSIFFFILLISCKLLASPPLDFVKLIQSEQYQDAIDSLNSIEARGLTIGEKNYLLGLCNARLKNYDEAIDYFNKAIKLDHSSEDLHYEYGQALYANNKLESARHEFAISAGKNFNYIPSIYYAAYISELLKDSTMAKSYYWKLIKDKRTDKKFFQIALFQYTKILLEMLRKNEVALRILSRNQITANINLSQSIPRYILPLLKKALNVDPKSSISIEIEQLSKQLEEEFKLDPNLLINGRRLSPEHFYLSLSHRIKYDTNVEATGYSSTLNESEIFTKNEFIIKKKFVSSPELRTSFTKYRNKDNPSIYQNNSLSFSSALRNKFEHIFKQKAASLLFDIEYSTLSNDRTAEHKIKYNYKTFGWVAGEQLSFFNFGDTYFKFKNSYFQNQTEIYNFKNSDFSVDQYIFIKDGQQLIIATIDVNKFIFKDNNSLNYDVYLMRFIHLIFDFIPTYTLQTILSTSLTNPKAQKEARGHEINFNPSIDLSKAITDHFRLSLNYSYTHNSSKQFSLKYSRQVIGTELNYTF